MTYQITLVEDDTAFTSLMKYNLEYQGYAVECLCNGRAAQIRLASAPIPDLVILDWNLPGLHGSELLRQLRSQTSTRNVPVVMLTCRTEKNDVEHAFKLGATDYVTKTAPLSILIMRIRNLVTPMI